MYAIGLVRVVSIYEPEFLNSHAKLIEHSFPEMNVQSLAIDNQPEGIHDDETLELAIPKIIRLVEENYLDKDAVIISCAGDPAVQILRKKLNIPVIGGGESAALLSRLYGNKVGIVGITEEIPQSYIDILGDSIVGSPIIPGIKSTLDLLKDDASDKILKHCENLIALGAEVLVFACTGLSTIRIAPLIEKHFDIKVIDCVYAEAAMTYGACKKGGFYEKGTEC